MGENRACIKALNYLDKSQVKPISECFPSNSASFYIPIQKIKVLFEDKLEGLTVEHLFLCPCPQCTEDGGPVEDRAICFDQQKLREKYSFTYALLVHIRRPGLIQKFQKYRLMLEGTRYLHDEDFNDLRTYETILDLDHVQKWILAYQYSFLVRELEPARHVTFISRQELLPIKEDAEAKGEGTFAQVRCFEFQYDDYRSRLFGENVKRFARKIFKPGMNKSAAKEWYNLQWLSKGENHPNLMAAFGAYEHGSHFFILQEEAERSLHDYLTRPSDEFDSQELWEQMKGIADGLSTLHKLFKGTKAAYHRDLKPANILILRRKLKIADFGLLEFKPVTMPGDTELTGIPNDHNTGNYAAPRQGRYTRDCDIWSLGCIMSEVATCDIQGQKGMKDYRMARMADGPLGKDTPRFYSGTRVKSAVLHKHSQLYGCVQTETLAANNSATYFRKKFYCKEFFELLERMLRHGRLTNILLETSGEGAGPDAANVVAILETLRKDALPEMVPDDQNGNPALEHFLQDPELLNSSMEAYLAEFSNVLNRSNRARFPHTTAATLMQYIVNLQNKQHAERRQQGLARIGPFLQKFEQFGELIARLPNAGRSMGFIWGPLKFLLETTNSCNDAFNDVVNIYGQIGRAQPSLTMYKDFSKIEPDLTRILIAVYMDIIQVNKWLVLYFQQRLWSELYSTTWTRYRRKIPSILARMTSRLKLIAGGANVDQLESYIDFPVSTEEQLIAEIDSENLSRRRAVYAWIKPTDMDNEQEYLRRIRAAYPGTCSWLLEDDTFQEWFNQQTTIAAPPKLLWLNGKPGAGKTVLASLVVEEAKKLASNTTVLVFYFKKEDSDRNDFFSMARTLLWQILEQNPHILDYFYSKCCSSGSTVLTTRVLVEELLKLALSNCESAYIVLDGLDECRTRRERGEVVSWFRDLIESGPPEIRHQLHCLFISQNDSARKDYRDLPKITADADNNEEDIEGFCKIQSRRLIEKLGIAENYADQIAKRVSTAAEGIFLFAHLVWINLCGQSSIHSLDREMETFSSGLDSLDDAYARIMQTIVDKPVEAERTEACMLLRWLVCAKRSLKMHEIQTLKSFDSGNGIVEFERRHFRVELQDLCESLVEVRADGSVELVHMTARTYLAKSHFLNDIPGELDMAKLCINYLNMSSFQSPSEEKVLAGTYGFMEYAILHWLRHLEAGLDAAPPQCEPFSEDLTVSLETLAEKHLVDPVFEGSSSQRSVPNRTRDVLQHFSHSQNLPQIQLLLVLTDKELKHFGSVNPDRVSLKFSAVVKAVRNCVERYILRYAEQDAAGVLRNKYGSHLFKCPKFSCKHFTDGFLTPQERDEHIERHELPARCTDEHCRGYQIGFATQAQLDRHFKENHPDLLERPHNFPTDEEIDESMREILPEPENVAEREPEIDQQAQEPSVVPETADTSTSEQAELLPTQATERVRSQRRKRNWECEYCSKVFTKKFNWESHLQTHGNNRRLQCFLCDQSCARQSDLTRHIKSHNPENAVMCGGVLLDGRTWGCRVTFARVDTLRKHYESQKGQQCLADRDREKHSANPDSQLGVGNDQSAAQD